MFNIVLFQPEIPPNTGNIIRLCVNTGARLHLIEPLGFELNDKQLKRAKLDYIPLNAIQRYPSFAAYCEQLDAKPTESKQINSKKSLYLVSTKATRIYTDVKFQPGDSLVFGPETRGLPATLLNQYADAQKIRIPMQMAARSLNLSNAVAIILYEAWRQQHFQLR